MNNLQDVIRERRSVRTYNGQPISAEDKDFILNAFHEAENPFGINIEFRLLDAKEHNLSSPVIVGADTYVAAKVSPMPQFELAYGYSFEKFCLDTAARGIGTVMLAATISRAAFERAMCLTDDEIMPLASPVGYPADKMSVRERLMRKSIKADERVSFETLFFDESFDVPLTKTRAGNLYNALSALRLAPSSVNCQPWRAVVCKNTVHFYMKKPKSASPAGNIRKVDMGISLAHFDLTLRESGMRAHFITADPEIMKGADLEYIISCNIE